MPEPERIDCGRAVLLAIALLFIAHAVRADVLTWQCQRTAAIGVFAEKEPLTARVRVDTKTSIVTVRYPGSSEQRFDPANNAATEKGRPDAAPGDQIAPTLIGTDVTIDSNMVIWTTGGRTANSQTSLNRVTGELVERHVCSSCVIKTARETTYTCQPVKTK